MCRLQRDRLLSPISLMRFKSIMHEIAGDGIGKVLVFTNTKKFVDMLELALKRNGWPAAGIHGDRTQLQRDAILSKFKKGNVNILVATDVAARGLDVDGITHVINYDFPNTTEDYIHRIGRTGRQQNKGMSHTMLTYDNARQAHSLIAVLREAKQDVPQELENLARSYVATKAKDQLSKRQNRYSWNSNNRFNKYRKSDRTTFGDRHKYF